MNRPFKMLIAILLSIAPFYIYAQTATSTFSTSPTRTNLNRNYKPEKVNKNQERQQDLIYLSYQGDPNALLGVSIGKLSYRGVGLYLSLWGTPNAFTTRSNQNIKVNEIGEFATNERQYTGEERETDMRFSIGLTKKVAGPIWAYGGVGALTNKKFLRYEDFIAQSTQWVKVSDASKQALLLEGGAVIVVKSIELKLGTAYSNSSGWIATFGIGTALKIKN